MARTPKREQTWLEMGQLQGLGLGRREIVSGDRDKFMVNTTHERVTLLTPHPDAEGFIRSDGRTLLFRHPSATIKMAIPEPLKAKAKRSKKSWEFAWGVLDDADIQALFAAVRTPAGRTGRAGQRPNQRIQLTGAPPSERPCGPERRPAVDHQIRMR